MTVKRITQLALLTAIVLIIFVVELRIPNFVPQYWNTPKKYSKLIHLIRRK